MLYTKNDLIAAMEGQIIDQNLKQPLIDEVVIDSRKAAKNKLFIALKGENNDGHDFLDQAFAEACEAAIIQDEIFFKNNPDKNLILVKDTFKTLYDLAKFARKRTNAKIIAITGSVGKTGTKEMLKSAFKTQGKTYATSGNLNNHFGLPLTVCNIPLDSEFAILEMGMNHLGEIEPLTKLAKPDVAIITNITSAHIGNFKNEGEIALAKSEIFAGLDNEGIAIINGDNIHFNFLKKQAEKQNLKPENILSFGKNLQSQYCLKSLETKDANHSIVELTTKNNGEISYKISSSHKAIIFNSLIIAACLDLLAKNIADGLKSLENIEASKGRGNVFDVKIGEKNITVIDDSYNANLASMKAGIEYLSDLKYVLKKKRTVAVLGDMFELGEKSDEIHEEVLGATQEKSIDLLLLAGENMKKATKILDKNFKTYLNSSELSLDIKNCLENDDILLVKGSRGMKMEEVLQKLS